jgi:DNA-binding beta-propeller fold protein YncE
VRAVLRPITSAAGMAVVLGASLAFGNVVLSAGSAAAVSTFPAGTVFIADTLHHRVVVLRPAGGSQSTVGTGLDDPQEIAVDASGDVFIADSGNDQVVEVPSGGGAQTTVGTGLQFPEGVGGGCRGGCIHR